MKISKTKYLFSKEIKNTLNTNEIEIKVMV